MKGQNMYLAFGSEVIYDDTSFLIEDNDKVYIVSLLEAAGLVVKIKDMEK